LNELHLFAGAGGGILGGLLLGHTPVCAVEIEPYCREVLLQRQRDRILPWFPIWDDVRTFDGKPWRGIADVVCGGFPCQDISAINTKGQGLCGSKSGLWYEMERIICEVRPRFVFVENSPILTVRGIDRVLGGLAEMGYNARWCVLGGGHLNYPIKRDRIWILGFRNHEHGIRIRKVDTTTNNIKMSWKIETGKFVEKYIRCTEPQCNISTVDPSWLISNGYAMREFNGLASEVDRIAAIGNGQIPAVAALAWNVLCPKY